jgi:hypothetical protein
MAELLERIVTLARDRLEQEHAATVSPVGSPPGPAQKDETGRSRQTAGRPA